MTFPKQRDLSSFLRLCSLYHFLQIFGFQFGRPDFKTEADLVKAIMALKEEESRLERVRDEIAREPVAPIVISQPKQLVGSGSAENQSAADDEDASMEHQSDSDPVSLERSRPSTPLSSHTQNSRSKTGLE